jgi:lipid-A-disaccharide synthase
MKQMAFDMPVLFCAGEPSGDVYAGLLIKALKQRYPDARVYSIGDGSMRQCGAEVIFEYRQLMTFGLFEGILSILRNYKMYRRIARSLRQIRLRTFVAVAYPGINLLLCRIAKRLGLRVYFFLPPQIWAWGTFRKYFIKKWVDKVISVFPFEAAFYHKQGINTVLIDNPLARELRAYKRTDHKLRIGFMPGSRWSQFRRNIPIARALMSLIRTHQPDLEFCLLTYDARLARAAGTERSNMSVIHEGRYQAMMNCDLLVVSSGTASLEAALLRVPQLFFSRPSLLDFHVARRLLRVNEYCLTNLYFGRQVVPAIVHPSPDRLLQYLHEKVKDHFGWH